ncbi:uncharacterized protein LOC111402362 isoform X2 [Olea europaea var. sylvestris]|uniref:Uncharacterized protein n=2 Tax=Olea europaea subsp. europaea TaxID=158383 RepID=A0A8S0UE24_OLEEU|nr:uncharacterized protein LOC111402362 isoform X2 [Olea europaea var. sylvestris]CAA3016346.1 Hypothetical predicted protein [Olea europaea subsp. europaea]
MEPRESHFQSPIVTKPPFFTPQQSSSPSSAPAPSSAIRLWKPAAQRNVRNQWSKLLALFQDWCSSSSSARSHAISLVNSFLSQKYMNGMDLGVLSDMPNIRTKACQKLFKQQELYRCKLLSCYKDMVAIVTRMVNSSRSMRCYLKGSRTSPLAQFSCSSQNDNDSGDAGGIPVFTFWSIAAFELASEVVQMFTSELNLKRLLVLELLSISDERVLQEIELHWSDEFYEGEFDDLSTCNLYLEEACEPVFPSLRSSRSSTSSMQSKHQADSDVLQVYLTTWLAEVNIDRCRLDEIFAIVGEEMHVNLS